MDIKIIDSCMPLIKSIANSFYGIEKEDLYQAGCIGVIDAYKHYKKNNKVKFSTFAYSYIFGEMYRLASNKVIKQSRDLLKLVKLVEKTRTYLTQALGKEPSIKEISSYLNIKEEDISFAINSTINILSLDESTETDTNLYNFLIQDNKDYDISIDIKEGLSELDETSKNIIKLRYFNDYTQQEVANFYNMSQVSVSRNETRSLKKLKEYMSNE